MATEPKTPPLALNPPAAGTCASCFYGQTTAMIGGPINALVRLCRRDTPEVPPPPNVSGLQVAWPIVADTDWCGEGADAKTMVLFKPVWA